MTRVSTCSVVAALAVSGLLLAGPLLAQATDGPEAVAPQAIHEAGTVAPGESIRHTFRVRNDGDTPLRIREVQPTCGCTVTEFDRVVEPGESGRVTAVVDTTSFRGPIAKSVTVLTDDTDNPRLRLTVRAEVVADVEVVPGYFRFMAVRGVAPERQLQTLFATDDVELEVLEVDSSIPHLRLEHRPAGEEERVAGGPEVQHVLEATLAEETPTGPLSGTVVVHTNHPQMARVEIPVAGYVKPLIAVSPPTADFGTFPPDDPRKGSVIVTNHGGDAVRLTAVDTDVDGLSAEIVERREGEEYALQLTLDPRRLGGRDLDGTLTIRTDSEVQPVVEVPVTGRVEPSDRSGRR